MNSDVEYEDLDIALKRCGSSWDAAQTHGLLSGRLAIAGVDGGFEWLKIILEGVTPGSATECEEMLSQLFESTGRELTQRMSEFMPLLPDEADSAEVRARALGRWCEGYLHGLVSAEHGDELKARLAEEPVADVIRDMLEITRATAGETDEETTEEAYTEVVEYVRVASQLVYEELADLRNPAGSADQLH